MRWLFSLSFLLLAGCQTAPSFKVEHSGYHAGDQFQVRQKLAIISYDYLQIPLVNPGVQFVKAGDVPERSEDFKFKILGYAAPGDIIRIDRFKIDGGWIPCQDDQFMANPVCEIVQGERQSMKVGVSLISKSDRTKNTRYRTGKMIYLEPDPEILQARP